ncbi:MAG: ABC transporter ATP-binding protein [Clostridiales bacterium]|nr:ABC transporter ATP-binding protein [Clostridiales bacterium]
MAKEPVIVTDHLTKSYGKSRGIVDLDLRVDSGDFFGFIGPNGAGKSTTIRTLLGLIAPTSGSARVLGYDIVSEKEKILQKAGYLPSEIHFYSGMKVRDVLKFSADLRKCDCGKTADELCFRLDLDPSRKVDDLSLGNRKKVGIVCAVQHHPELLILDEPTSGLDPLIQKEFFTILREENEKGSTIFFSSHILSEVQTYCRSAALIKDGKILLSDKVGNLEQTGTKKVTIAGAFRMEKITGLSGVTITDQEDAEAGASEPCDGSRAVGKEPGQKLSFLYQGDIRSLLTVLSGEGLTDVTISEPSLEEIFMHYYES